MVSEKLDKDFEASMRKALYSTKIEKTPSSQTSLAEYNQKEVIEKVRQTYPQAWPAYNSAKTREKIIAEDLLLELLDYFEEPKHPMGRKPFSIKERILCMFIYSYGGFSSRRAMSDIEHARRRNVISKTPHFNSVLNMFRDQAVTRMLFNILEITALPLRPFEDKFSIDATGFSSAYYERWLDIRTEKPSKKKKWMKLNLVVGNKTNVIVSVVVKEGFKSDCVDLPELVKNAARFFELKEVSADKGYLSNKNLEAIANIGAIPFIPFKVNTSTKKRGRSLWKTMYEYFTDHQEDFMKHYHLRSNSETAFSMIKKNFRSNLRTKTFTSQVNEVLVKCICHNLSVLVQESFELGLNIDFNKCYQEYLEVIGT